MAAGFILLLLSVLIGVDTSRIVGGRDAASHSRPYMASMQTRGKHQCGALLVREDFVLTAAHCELTVPFTIVLGVNSLSANESTRQEFRAIRAFPHPNYDEINNDIMLLKLDRRAQLTEAVRLISLKKTNTSRCITAGWGATGNDLPPKTLQEVNVTILPQKTCQRRYRFMRVTITAAMVCGVGQRLFQGFCSGDSGGPLVCDGAAAGIVSFSGFDCGDPSTPDVYTRISSFMRWITGILNNN